MQNSEKNLNYARVHNIIRMIIRIKGMKMWKS